MVKVHLWSGLRAFAENRETVEVEASTVGEMLDRLAETYPGLEETLQTGVSVAVDGRIFAQGHTEPIKPDSEVYLMQRLKGG